MQLLERVTLAAVNCANLDELVDNIDAGVGVIVLTEAALPDQALPRLMRALAAQPTWSDVPIVMLARDRALPSRMATALNALSNVTLLDRPVSTRSMLSAVQTALGARRRQYQIREHIDMLARAEAALRETDRRKDEFLATLAHELRNPLAPLRTGIAVLNAVGSEDARATRMIGVMGRQIDMLIKLIDELLDVARISSGKIDITCEPVDLRQVIDMALESCNAGEAVPCRQRLTLSMPDDGQAVWVMGDRSRLVQAVCNLLNNAIKYTPEHGDIGVALAADARMATIRVSDTGVGIPPDMLAAVFEMFAQIEGSRHRSQGGLGLGLSLVRSLVELHGGQVIAESAGLGEGSTFTLRLPLMAPIENAGGMALSAAGGQSGGMNQLDASVLPNALQVLIVDDNVDAAESLALYLRALGHVTRCVYNGQAGLAAAADIKPDVVFCDIGMPGLNGYEVAARMRQDSSLKSTCLVALTGWGGEHDKRRATEAGFDHHLTKPASLDEIEVILAGA